MVLLKTLLRMLLLPPGSLILLAAVGLLLLRNRPRSGRTLIALALASLWLLSLEVVATGLQRLAEHNPALDPTQLQGTRAGAIVILGGGGQRRHAPEYGGPAADPYLLERLAYGAWLARQTQLPVLVTGNGIEAEAMRATLARNFGVETRWIEDQSRDTFENARNSVAMLRRDGIKRILLVSSAAHVWRGSQEFAAAGVEVVGAPVHVWTPPDPGIPKYLPTADALLVSSNALHELIGDAFRRLFAVSGLRRQPG
jgi:uncharacterized SAM-binding protein YcdF (DUF218 family)